MLLASFQFFSPSFLWALPVAAGLPVAAHLWTKFRSKPVAFASLMFFPSEVAPAAQVSRLDHRLLLALRVLALVSFALGFARPVWFGQAQFAPAGGRRVAIVLDRTASMNQTQGLGTAFDVAKFEADMLLAKLDAKDQVAVVCADRACAPAWAGWLSPAEARARLGKLAPSWEAGDVGRAAQVVQGMNPTEVVVLTDGQGLGQCHPRSADALVRNAPEVRVVGEGKDNGWLKKEKPAEVGEKKPEVAVQETTDPEAVKAFRLALGRYYTRRVPDRQSLFLFAGFNGSLPTGFNGAWSIGRYSSESLPIPIFEGSRILATADWSAPELAVFTGVSRAALIGTSLSDGVVLKPQSGDRILLRFSDESPALIARDKRYILAGSPTGGPHPLANSPAFVPLVHELVKALLPPPPLPAHPGDALNLPVPVGGRILSPGGASVTGRFGEPGIYRAVNAKGETTGTCWCEVEASEVNWERDAPPSQDSPHSASASASSIAAAERRAPTELWPLFAILALLALLVEPLLIWHAGRKAKV